MTSPDSNNIFNSHEQNARNTFYVSDSQRQKQNLFKSDFHKPHSHNRGNGGGNHYFAGAGNSASRQVQRVMWNGPGGQDNQPPASSMVQGGGFTKPRALSR